MSQCKLLMYESGLHFDVSSGDRYYNRHKKIHRERSQEIICWCFSLFFPTVESLFTVSGVRLKPEMCDLLASYRKGHHPAGFSKCWWKERARSPRFSRTTCIAVSVLICFHLLRSFKSNSTLDQGFYTTTCDVEYFKYDVQGNSA